MDRHHPEDVYAKVFESRQLLGKGGHGAGVGILTQVHFVDNRIAAPFGVFHSGECGVAFFGGFFGHSFPSAGGEKEGTDHAEGRKDFFHKIRF